MHENELLTDTLDDEYEVLLEQLGEHPTDEQIVCSLVEQADWTDAGARTVLMLARAYGTFVLRNALALAEAMDLEDGESEL